MSAAIQCQSGWLRRASSIMFAELSSPVNSVSGHMPASTSVLLPGPQPRSMTLRTGETEIRAAKSWHGRVRCSENFRYWPALQVGILCGAECFLQSGHRGWESLIGRHAADRLIERLRAHGAGVADLFERAEEAGGVDNTGHSGQLTIVVDLLVDGDARGCIVKIDGDNIRGAQGKEVVLGVAGVVPMPAIENQTDVGLVDFGDQIL